MSHRPMPPLACPKLLLMYAISSMAWKMSEY